MDKPPRNDSAAMLSVRFELRDSLRARVLKLFSVQPFAGSHRLILRSRCLSLAAITGSVVLALVATMAPAKVFSMTQNSPEGSSAAPMQAPAGDQKPAGDEKAAGELYDATKVDDLRGHLGEFVQIQGTPTGAGQNKTGAVLYLNFGHGRNGGVTVVFFVPKGNATPAGGEGTRPASAEDLKTYVGKNVIVKGRLSDYQGGVQMVIPYLEQIKIQPTEGETGAEAKK